MKLSKKNIIVLLVCCILSLVVAFSFQHGFNTISSRDLTTDSGFDSDFGGSGGGGGSSSSGSSGSGGSSGSVQISEFDSLNLIFGMVFALFVVFPLSSYFIEKNNKKYILGFVIFSLIICFNIGRLFAFLFIIALISFFSVFSFLPLYYSIPIAFLIFCLIFYGILHFILLVLSDFIMRNNDNFSSVMNDPNIVNEAYDIYVKVQKAWSKNDLSEIRNLLSDSMYNMYSVQVMTMIKKNQRNEMSNFKFVRGSIHEHKSCDDKDIYVITLQVYCKDYLVDTKTNKVIKGSRWFIKNYVYSLTFEKYKDIDIKECPNCKAPLPLSGESVKCSYCGSIINKKSTSMVLVDKKMLLQD